MNTASQYHSRISCVGSASVEDEKWHGRGRRFGPNQVHQTSQQFRWHGSVGVGKNYLLPSAPNTEGAPVNYLVFNGLPVMTNGTMSAV